MVSQVRSRDGAGNLHTRSCYTLMPVQGSMILPCSGLGMGGVEAHPVMDRKVDEQKGLQTRCLGQRLHAL